MLGLMTAAALVTGTVVGVYDGDGPIRIRDAAGTMHVIRLRGVQAPDFERAAPCRERRAGYLCSDRLATASRDRMRRLVMGKRLACRTEGRSFKRENAWCQLPDGRDLSCVAIAEGIAVRWDRYWPRGRGCG